MYNFLHHKFVKKIESRSKLFVIILNWGSHDFTLTAQLSGIINIETTGVLF